MRALLSICLAVVCVGSPGMASMVTAESAPSGTGGNPAGTSGTTVFGYVWNARNEPIPYAAVRLRNAVSGLVESNAVTAHNGEFTFGDVEGGTYVIEYVGEHGQVIAVGHVFTVSPGETVATFIRLTSRASWLAAFLGSASNIAATAVTSAAGLGVTALAPPSRDATPER